MRASLTFCSRRAGAALLAFFLMAVAGSAAMAGPFAERLQQRKAASAGDDGSDADELATERGASRLVLPPDTRVDKDVAYGPDPAQRLDVYRAQRMNGKGGSPILLMVHGGAWMVGDKASGGVVSNKVAHWLPKGYVFVSANYRMSRSPDPVQQAEDIGRALAFVQAQAVRWGGDPARVVLMGHSSGAHLVALLSADASIATRQGAKPWLGTVVLDSAALDVAEVMQRRHFAFYDRVFGSDPQRWRAASPFDRLAGTPAPTMLVCSSLRQDSCPAARAFADKATALGARFTVLPVALKHGGINGDLGSPSRYTEQVDGFLASLGLP